MRKGTKPRTLVQFEHEATRAGKCLVHARGQRAVRKVYELRYGRNITSLLYLWCILDAHHVVKSNFACKTLKDYENVAK